MNKEVKQQARLQGQVIEALAAEYLRQRGITIVETNMTCRHGEIDIIARQDQTLIFVEVRYRRRPQFGSGAETVTWGKQQKLVKTAQVYLQEKHLTNSVNCRFDVISVGPAAESDDNRPYQFNWIPNAFGLHS